MKKTDNSVLNKYFLTYCHVNALGPDWQGELRRTLENLRDQNISKKFKFQLAQAITNDTISAEEIEYETGLDLETEDEKIAWLTNLWRHLYDTEPPKPNNSDET